MTREDIAKSLAPERWVCHPFDNVEYCKITDIHEAVLKMTERGSYMAEILKEGSAIPLWCGTGEAEELREDVRMWRVDHYSEAFVLRM